MKGKTMLQPNLLSALSQIRYQEMLQEAEVERRYRQTKRQSPSLGTQVGGLLSVVGRKIGRQVQTSATTPALRAK
jgi:hypothetical protein